MSDEQPKGFPIFCRRCQSTRGYAPNVNPFDDMGEWINATDLATDECPCPQEIPIGPMPEPNCPTCKKPGTADHYDADKDAMVLKCEEGHEYVIESGPIELTDAPKQTQGHDWMGEKLVQFDCHKCGVQFQIEEHKIKSDADDNRYCFTCAKILKL